MKQPKIHNHLTGALTDAQQIMRKTNLKMDQVYQTLAFPASRILGVYPMSQVQREGEAAKTLEVASICRPS